MDNIKLTTNQRAMLCWLDEAEGNIPRIGLKQNNPELAAELMMSLENLGLVKQGEYSAQYSWSYPLTEEGKAYAEKTRYGKTSCKACVQAFCVCNLKLVCLKGEGHSGCRGSHD